VSRTRDNNLFTVDVLILRGYHTAVFISARLSSPSVDNGPRHIAEGSCQPRAWYRCRYENSVI